MAGSGARHDVLAALAATPTGPRVLEALERVPGAWIVGGAVRDALLGRAPRELDVVVEGDPAPLLEVLDGDVRHHERFGVATVRMPEGTVDVVRARAEAYPHPGALPEVRPGTLEEDLARRDVTVNTFAARPGVALRSVPGAQADLDHGLLRVLHPASFRDDPTRLWRVARYAARLGFAVEPGTAALARAADPRTVSGVRLGNELRLALREPAPLAALRAARALNQALLVPGLTTEPAGLDDALALARAAGARPDLVLLAACCAPVDARLLLAWLDELGFTAAERDVVAAGSRASTWEPLRAARTPAEVARAARGAPLEVVALAGGPNARRWIDELRHVRLEITGDDLLAAGVPEGPELGRRLAVALDRKLDEGLSGRDAELAAALG
jgi:tRNA nucleotidyltransferase (CCA-adding enzyme)